MSSIVLAALSDWYACKIDAICFLAGKNINLSRPIIQNNFVLITVLSGFRNEVGAPIDLMMLSSHLRLGFSSGLFPSSFAAKI
jgi:hypothetical protein